MRSPAVVRLTEKKRQKMPGADMAGYVIKVNFAVFERETKQAGVQPACFIFTDIGESRCGDSCERRKQIGSNLP